MARTKPKSTRKTKTTPKRANAGKRATKAPATPARRPLTPYLSVNDAAGAIEWYKKAFGAKVVQTEPGPGGRIMHAELKVAGDTFYLSDIFPGSDVVDPTRAGPSVTMSLWTKNAQKLWDSCVANGAKVTLAYADQFWGDTYGKVLDPYGHSWSFSWKSKLNAKQLEQLRVEAMKTFGQA